MPVISPDVPDMPWRLQGGVKVFNIAVEHVRTVSKFRTTWTVCRGFRRTRFRRAILPNNTIPNSLAMEFNWLTICCKAGPATTPILVKLGERVRIRIVNLGMDHHPMHIHGHQFYVTGTEGGRIRTTAVEPANTVLVGVAQARDVEFVADNPGDWHFHCHLPHHMMNQMASMVGPIMMSHANMMRPGSMTSGLGIVEGRATGQSVASAFGRDIAIGAGGDCSTRLRK